MAGKAENMTQRATVGYAVGEGGEGIAYASVRGASPVPKVVRVTFKCRAQAALVGRDASYAAMLAVATELRRNGARRIAFEVDDEHLVSDLREHRPVPAPLMVPYVMLGCELNRFVEASVGTAVGSTSRDLAARARAEVSLHVAA